MTSATLEQAELAKQKLRALLAESVDVRGVGIVLLDDGYGVKVGLLRKEAKTMVPDDVDGVPVIVDVVGAIRAC
jgi:hypothetical protein